MTTPFSEAPAGYAGARPDLGDPVSLIGSGRPWLGRVDNAWGMIELPPLDPDGYQPSPPSPSAAAHTLINGGTATHILPSSRRSWSITWPALEYRDLQVVDAFQRRAFGTGPWVFVNPEGRNRLTVKQSMCQDASQWGTTGGTVAADTTPGYIAPGSALLWTPAASGNAIGPGTVAGSYILPDVSRSAVHVPAEPFTVSFWVQAPSGTVSVSARIVGRAATGAPITTLPGPAVTVGTNWQQVAVAAAPGAFDPTCLYLMPQLVTNDGKAVRFSNPQASYTAQVLAWGLGGGVPRVTCPQSPDAAAFLGEYDMSASLALAEYVVGVA